MTVSERCAYIANSFYNRGLQQARDRDLTHAAESLKRSLQFNKRHTDARNLLGLVYFEIGETADALVQWVISLNLKPRGNDADRYLDELQQKGGLMEAYSDCITQFNQALALAKEGNYNVAIPHLVRATEANRGHLRAQILSGLLYMATEDWNKAYRCLQAALRIDRYNPDATRYMNYIQSSKLATADTAKKGKASKKKAGTGEEQPSSDVIIPSTYRESSALQTIVNIGIGLLIGAAAVYFIYMPTRISRAAAERSRQVITVSEKLSDANNEIRSLQEDYAELEEKYNAVLDGQGELAGQYEKKLAEYQKLAGLIDAMRSGDLAAAARIYTDIDGSQITDIEDGSSVSAAALYGGIRDFFDDDGYVQLTGLGDGRYEEQDYSGALDYYGLSLAVHPENPVALYKCGLAYVRLEDRASANEMFAKVIAEYPESSVAEMARSERGY